MLYRPHMDSPDILRDPNGAQRVAVEYGISDCDDPNGVGPLLIIAGGTLKATTGWVSPLSVSDPISSSVIICSTATATRCAMRICPSFASAQRRAARLQTVPIAV